MWKSPLMLLSILLCAVTVVFSQASEPDKSGRLLGAVRDSIDHHPIQAATLSVYNTTDSSLIVYQLSDNAGNFKIGKLPVNLRLKLIVSSVGYAHKIIPFTILEKNDKTIDLKEIQIQTKSITLDEVAISNYRPPVEMNGDTLEFNADAFKMDKNAVVEDLMRKLPGVTIWGDGKITVNGRTVKNVLVEGKPFFGGQTTVATQNLPKDAVDKIQVYTDRDRNSSPLDSLLNVNLKLKSNKKFGVFGKVGGGYGTRKRGALDGMLSTFNPRSQVSLAGSTNNVNILSKDVKAMINNSSFKGVGVNIEFQPDFAMEGLHQSNTAGLNFQHDFISDPTYNKNNRLDGNVFLNDHLSNLEKVTQTLVSVSEARQLEQNYVSSGSYRQWTKNLSSGYNKKNDKWELYLNPVLNFGRYTNQSVSSTQSTENQTTIQSVQNGSLQQQKDDSYLQVKTGFNRGYYKLDLVSSLYRLTDDQHNSSAFTDLRVPNGSSYVNRHYHNQSTDYYNEFKTAFDPKKVLFKDAKFYGINAELENIVKVDSKNRNNFVADVDSLTSAELRNGGLSVKNTYQAIEIAPKLALNRLFINERVNRYRKSVYLYGAIVYQAFSQESGSTIQRQVFRHSYGNYLPYASIYLANDQFGDHHSTAKLEYKKTTTFPTLDQRAPLPDDANRYYQYVGNINLRPAITNEIVMTIDYNSFHMRNVVDTYSLTFKTGETDNSIADSTIYDNAGRALGYLANINGSKYLIANGEVYKAFKYKENQLQLSGKTSFTIAQNPYYANSVRAESASVYSNSSIAALYTMKELLAFSYNAEYSQYSSRLSGSGANNLYRNSTLKNTMSFSINLAKKIIISSNASFNHTSFSSQLNTRDFTIWNATFLYRFTKTNQAEIKFSALDLLRENTNIINYGTNNNITVGQVNVLQNYFLLGIAYYPRKFGNDKKKN